MSQYFSSEQHRYRSTRYDKVISRVGFAYRRAKHGTGWVSHSDSKTLAEVGAYCRRLSQQLADHEGRLLALEQTSSPDMCQATSVERPVESIPRGEDTPSRVIGGMPPTSHIRVDGHVFPKNCTAHRCVELELKQALASSKPREQFVKRRWGRGRGIVFDESVTFQLTEDFTIVLRRAPEAGTSYFHWGFDTTTCPSKGVCS